MIDRYIYICVCVKQKCFLLLSSISLTLLHLINFTSSGKLIFETLMQKCEAKVFSFTFFHFT